MFLVSSQATLAYHYCHGQFQSLAVASNSVTSCCGEEGEDSKCSDEEESSCCTDIVQQLVIDDFNIAKKAYSFNGDCKGCISCLPVCVLFDVLTNTDAASINLFQGDFSPPPPLENLLISICVLRI